MKRILLISTNAIGDTYIACSCFLPLKKMFPELKIDIVALESSQFFLDKIDFDNLFLLKKKSYREVIKYLSLIRENKYDLVLNFFPGQVNSLFFQFSLAKQKSGFRNFKKKLDWHNEDDSTVTIPLKKNINYTWKYTDNFLRRIMLPLKAAGIEVSELVKPVIESNDNAAVFDYILHLFSSDPRKSIPDEKIAALLKELAKDLSKKICLIGSDIEINRIEKFLKPHPNLSFIKSPAIENTVGMLKKTQVFIGVDSFPLHIADAHSIKTLGIFTCTDENTVFQNMDNKYIFKISDINKFRPEHLIHFMKQNNLY